MAIAITLKSYLEGHNVEYDTVEHPHTESAVDSAKSAHVPAHQMAKAVVLEDNAGYIVSVLPWLPNLSCKSCSRTAIPARFRPSVTPTA
jgi:prolyl-tRNA editing enzyme YbaK/EbsC (Cys-tRNA(Pro) deacylase)